MKTREQVQLRKLSRSIPQFNLSSKLPLLLLRFNVYMVMLGQYLANCSCSLGGNDIEDAGASVIAEALKVNSTLHTLG